MILYSSWTALSLSTRNTIAQAFGISKTTPTHVQDNRIVSDGYKVEDVENALSTEAMQKYSGSKSKEMAELFRAVVAKAEGGEIDTSTVIIDPTHLNAGGGSGIAVTTKAVKSMSTKTVTVPKKKPKTK